MADRYPLFHFDPADNLLRTPFIADQYLGQLPDLAAYPGLRLVVTPQQRQIMGLPRSVALQAQISAPLPADGRFIPLQQLGNPCLAIFGFLQDVNLVSFLLGKLRVASHVCSSCLAVR